MILKTKVGEHVDIRTIAKQVIIEKDGIAKAADFVQAGIHAADVVNMCNAGYLDRIRHGYYQLAEADTSSEEQLIAALIPKAIICVESALFHYGKILQIFLLILCISVQCLTKYFMIKP